MGNTETKYVALVNLMFATTGIPSVAKIERGTIFSLEEGDDLNVERHLQRGTIRLYVKPAKTRKKVANK